MNIRILVVDDDPLTRREIKAMLTKAGYEVETAATGMKAVGIIEERDLDIVFLDLKMPEMSGIEVLKAVKSVKPYVFVIMITAYATIETAVEAMKSGAYDYITKPFKPNQLLSLVEDVLEEREFESGLREVEFARSRRDRFEIFLGLLREGKKGLFFSKDDPERIVRKLNEEDGKALRSASVFLIAPSGASGRVIHPLNTRRIEEIVDDIIGEKGNVAAFFDGIEVLIEYHPWKRVKGFFMDLIKRMRGTGSHLIISADPAAIRQDEFRELESLLRSTHMQPVFESLANSIRRNIIGFLSLRQRASFTTILNGIEAGPSPKFSFHLKKLEENSIIAKDPGGMYSLTERGKRTAELFSEVERQGSGKSDGRVSLVISTKR